MNRQDRIAGRFACVTCHGKTNRTCDEETGDGIPMVCLPTAGTDGWQFHPRALRPPTSPGTSG